MSTRRRFLQTTVALSLGAPLSSMAQTFGRDSDNPVIGTFGDSGPKRSSEAGVGALMAWADQLWAVTYLSEPNAGSGTGLYVISDSLDVKKLHVSNGVYANRMHHEESSQINIGPYMIDIEGKYRIIEDLMDERLTATMPHLRNPKNLIYILTMEGMMYEVDVQSLKANKLFDLTKELDIKGDPHFKGAFTSQGRVVVANNTYNGPGDTDGRLAEWDGNQWAILEKKPFMEVQSRRGFGDVIFATGWDELSAILKVRTGGEWLTYRLPKGTQAMDQYWCTEWTRIREVESERYLMDLVGIFYELPSFTFHNKVWGIRPICSHLRIVPDFCSFRGHLVLAGNEASSAGGNYHAPQSQSGIWFGQTDDLWNWGKPKGWGGVWRDTYVRKGQASDPFLMTGFDKKAVHFSQKGNQPTAFAIEVDITGYGEWKRYTEIALEPNGYTFHVFPDGFSAHWVRIVAYEPCTATVEFVYS